MYVCGWVVGWEETNVILLRELKGKSNGKRKKKLE
jgi:hypothetical protein